MSKSYSLDKSIGKGGFSSVYSGRDRKTKASVAIKVISKIRSNKERVQAEVNVLKRLDHPNIIKFVDFYEDSENYFLVTEKAPGINLSVYTKRREGLSERRAYSIFKQLISAMRYLYRNKIAHRDIKPGNVIYDPETGRVKLIDFGFSIINGEFGEMPKYCGTKHYMAPELFAKSLYDPYKIDIWALGVTLYKIIYNKYPFNGENNNEIYNSIKHDSVLFIKPNTSKELKKLIRIMLSFNSEDRPSLREIKYSKWFDLYEK